MLFIHHITFIKCYIEGWTQTEVEQVLREQETVLRVSVVVSAILTSCSVKPVVSGCNCRKIGVSLFSAVRNSRHKHINILYLCLIIKMSSQQLRGNSPAGRAGETLWLQSHTEFRTITYLNKNTSVYFNQL